MNSIKNILVPIDFSKNSLKALEYAIVMTERIMAKLHVLHAYRLIKPTDYEDPETGIALKRKLEDSLNVKLKDLEFQYLISHAIDYELITAVGFAVGTIQNIVTSKNIDMVVMGARGKRELEEVFGSTTWSVIKSLSVPVIAVPADANIGEIDHIILANENPGKTNPHALDAVRQIASSFNTNIVILKCNLDKDDIIEGEEQETSPFYKKVFKGIKVTTQLCNKVQFMDGLKKQLYQNDSGMLVLLPKENVFLESYFDRENLKEVIVNTKIPLLMIQRPLVP